MVALAVFLAVQRATHSASTAGLAVARFSKSPFLRRLHAGEIAAYSGFLLGALGPWQRRRRPLVGRREWRRPAEERYLLAVLDLAGALSPLMIATTPAILAPLLVVAGLGFGPATIALFEALDVLAPRHATEALTWVTTAEALSTALGAAASERIPFPEKRENAREVA